MEQFLTWCEANGYNPSERTSRTAFDAAHAPQGAPKRQYSSKQVTLVGVGQVDGETFFREATGISVRDREQAAAVLRWQMASEQGAENIRVFVTSQEL